MKLLPVITFTLAIALIITSCKQKEDFNQKFIASDIPNFWKAYDKINQTSDTVLQKQYLKDLYINKGTQGLKNLIEVRGYSENEYLKAITSYPNFWESIKETTLRTEDLKKEITTDIEKLKNAYPDLKPSDIYFLIGAFRTNGTIKNNTVLVGCELALADKTTFIEELPKWRQPYYKEYKPLKSLALLCTHEYIHTQQNEIVHNLLSMCLYEGVAEFISCKVTDKPSSSPAIDFGKRNKNKIVDKFVDDLYLMINNSNWLWGENRNELQVRDLGYYIGYEICERFYNQSTNKTKAIKELIELDFTNEKAVERIVDASALFPKPITQLYNDYENSRPTVLKIKEFENGSKQVNPNTKKITLVFSEKLNGTSSGLDFGSLGKDFYPKVDNSSRKWGENKMSYSFNVALEPNKRYQMMISSNFRKNNGIALKPYIIEFETKN